MHQILQPIIEKEECELDLTQLEDRQLFSEAAEDLYLDAMNYEPHIRVEQYNLLALPGISGREVFQTAEQILIDIQKTIQQPPEVSLSNSHIDHLQSLYNDLATICEYIENTCQTKLTETTQEQLTPKLTSSTATSSSTNFQDKEVIGRIQRADLPLHHSEPDITQTLKITTPKQTALESSDFTQKVDTTSSANQNNTPQQSKFKPLNTIPHLKSFSPGIIKPNVRLDERSLTAQFLQSPPYTDFISNNYTSPTAFERLLDMKITQIEAKTTDAIERWLGEKTQSPFIYLQDKPIAEILELSHRKNIRATIIEAGMKYETFLTWIDLLPTMLEQTNIDVSRTFGELFTRFVIETEMRSREHKY